MCRLLCDLLMWQPLAPTQVEIYSKMSNQYEDVHINLASHIGQINAGGDKFFMCRSTIRDGKNAYFNWFIISFFINPSGL